MLQAVRPCRACERVSLHSLFGMEQLGIAMCRIYLQPSCSGWPCGSRLCFAKAR